MNKEQLKKRLREIKNRLWQASEVDHEILQILLLVYKTLEEVERDEKQNNRES